MLEFDHMSLQEKLAKKSQELEEAKKGEAEKAEDSALSPVRNRIKELELQKSQLDLVKGSLELKSDKNAGIGEGMKEYKAKTLESAKKESSQLDAIVEKNKEALKTMGVEDKEQLAENPEFAEDAEVVSYKEAKGKVSGLNEADAALQEKLKTLGVENAGENGSYESAEKALTEKIQSLDSELLQEKLKTPEGKKEAVDTIASDLEKKMKNISFKKNEAGIAVFDLGDNSRITISPTGVKAENLLNAKIVPDEVAGLEKTYDPAILKEAVKDAYGKKIDGAFARFDKETKNIDAELKADLEKASPEKWPAASKAIREFQESAAEFKKTLKQKSEELKAKGVDFNPQYVQNYGGEYEKYARLAEYDQDNSLIAQAVNNPQAYPPKVNFDELKEFAEKRNKDLQELTEDIKKLETEEDIQKFTKGTSGKSGISRAHGNIMATKFDSIRRPDYNPNETSFRQEQVKGLMKFASYNEAANYFKKQQEERESFKQKALEVVETGIDKTAKAKELRKEMAVQKMDGSIGDIERQVSKIETDRKDALALMTELVKLESILPKEDVILNGNEIRIPSVDLEIKKLNKERETEGENLKALNSKLSALEANEPKLFGKEKWRSEVAALKEEKTQLEQKINKMSNEDYRALLNKSTYRIPTTQYSDVERLVNEQKFKQTSSGEIFADLKAKLDEMVNKKVPTSVLNLHKEYKELEKKLSK
jgi:hypothetical protein